MDGKLEKADLHYLGKSNRARAFADSYSKVCRIYTFIHVLNWLNQIHAKRMP